MAWLINATQLEKFRKSQKSLIILDASWHLPQTERNAKQEFIEKHIIDAHFLDLSLFHDTSSSLPNTILQDEKVIGQRLGELGIRNNYKIIFYDNSDLHSACRALWLFQLFGHNSNQLYILNGGLAAWEKQNGKMASGTVVSTNKQYIATLQPALLRSLAQIKTNLEKPTEQIIDMRHALRYAGSGEQRPGLRAGHIPGSVCFPYTSFFDKENQAFLSIDKIRRTLISLGIDMGSPIISTCGTGMTAPILNFVLELINHPAHALYDGSWTEWGAEQLYPGESSLTERPVIHSLDEVASLLP